MITLYIYNKRDGRLASIDTGTVEDVLRDLKEGHDFTLERPPDSITHWAWNGQQWIKPELDENQKLELQERIWEGIKESRYEATVSGIYVASVDKVFHTDATSVIQYNNIGNMIALGNFEPIQWKVMDNTWITLTEEVFKELQTAMIQNTNRVFQVAEEHKAEMMQMDNPEDYDYSEGWDISEPSN